MSNGPVDIDAIKAWWKGFEGPYTARLACREDGCTHEECDNAADAVVVDGNDTVVARVEAFDGGVTLALAERFAEAPNDVAALCDEVERLRNEAVRHMRSAREETSKVNTLVNVIHGLVDELKQTRAIVAAVRVEQAARAAWLASLPPGACTSPPTQELLDAEERTRGLLTALDAQKGGAQ